MFILSKLASLLLRPSTVLLLCCAAGLLGRRRWLLWLGVGGLAAVLLLPLDQLALLPLEDRFAASPALPAHIDGIVVLGGAVEPELTAQRGLPSLNGAAERMTEGVALARRFPDARLVFTGGQGVLLPGEVTEADTAAQLFTSLGIAPERLVLEGASRTTYENAALTKALVRPRSGESWVLVTSADHMARAVGVFRAAGWDVIAWPVGYKSGWGWRLWLPGPLGGRLTLLDEAAHEWVGMAVYWALGRSSAPFPR